MEDEVYLSIFGKDDGRRKTSFTLLGGVHGESMDDLKQKAQKEYPDDYAVPQTKEDWRRTVSNDLRCNGSELVTPPEPTAEELADQQAQQEAYEAQITLNAIQTRATRMMLAGGDIAAAQSDYQTALMSISDEAALKMPDYFPTWDGNGHQYAAGDRVMYGDVLYKVLQTHTSQSDWAPNSAPSLFAKVLTSVAGEPLPWQQPDSTNPYMIGDRVTYKGKVYESLIDNNVWAPDAYPQGWKEIEV